MADEYYFEEGCFITELHNSADDPAVSVARARVPVGVTTRWHVLAGIVERYLIESGEGEVWVGEAPARRVVAGDTVVIAPGQRQRIRNPGAVDLLFLAVCTPRFVPSAYTDVEPEHDRRPIVSTP
ncbi:MAG: cupin domain-containing protein [Zoogloeaceae bacterium]|uniref:cupin domain-containing protein n=1 Tax=Denitromonas sp. TaxID=2734609 RepID=UPI001D2E7C95|nr:cupin domain-containing protein [Rhodocyclaceae bacterium]MCP5223512.1 cupin domain-containing protein [Zoogloeaceae bacterium]HPR08105.1 cupin domain-containing protein [Denitromonas sp.]